MSEDAYKISPWNSFVKRGLDLACSIVGLLLIGWLIILAYIVARIETGNSGFFTQRRIGCNQQPFNAIKIRTMRVVSGNASTVTTENDERITKWGGLFRRTKIDELPQLINVLKGDMSLVGPRPTVEFDYDKMDDRQKKRANVLPGITGLAQIRGNTSLSWPQRIEYDLEYILHQNLWFDIRIILETVISVFTGRAESHPCGDDEWK